MKNEDANIIKAFSKSLPDYLRDVETISGKLFYSLTWNQIDEHLSKQQKLNVLDMGCGFGLTSIWFSEQGHTVTGIDITPEMVKEADKKAKEKNQDITFLKGQIDGVEELVSGTKFDWIICHNVLGYVDQPIEAIEKLKNLLHHDGYLSIVTHNPAAKVLKKAIVVREAKNAKEMINQEKEFNSLIGTYVQQYSSATYFKWYKQLELELIQYYGIRCVYDFINQEENEMEFQDLLALELELGKRSPYRDIAFFSHYILKKI